MTRPKLLVLVLLVVACSPQAGEAPGTGGSGGKGAGSASGGSAGGGAGGSKTGGTGGGGNGVGGMMMTGGAGGAPGTGGVASSGGASGTGGAGAGGAGAGGAGIDAAGGLDVAVADSAPDTAQADGAPIPANWVKGLMTVGYSSLKILSRDNGVTWDDSHYTKMGDGDDFDLLRAVAYSKGLWVAVGWKVWRSMDGGLSWVDHGRFQDHPTYGIPCSVVDGLTANENGFFAACNINYIFHSLDGLKWTTFTTVTQGFGAHPFLDYDKGMFTIWGDPGVTFQSKDAKTWTVVPGLVKGIDCNGTWKSAQDCEGGSFYRAGAFYRFGYGNGLRRSPAPGAPLVLVFPFAKGAPFRDFALVEGMVAP